MSLTSALTNSIAKLGGVVEISLRGKSVRARAIVEPLRYKNKIYIGGEFHSLGAMKKDKYLFIGTPDIELSENASVIESVGGKYIVKRCERYYVQDRPIYVWAIMESFGKPLEDDYDTDKQTD